MDELKTFYSLFKESYVQTFDDKKKDRKGLTRTFPMSEIKDHKEWLINANKDGAGVFFTPNPCKHGRIEANVTSIEWIYVDMDEGTKDWMMDKITGCPIYPHIITESDRSYHLYWKCHCENKKQFEKIINGLLQYFDGDESVSSTNEVLRLPPFFHMKGKPFKVKIKYIAEDIHNYSVDDMIEAHPYLEPMAGFQRKHCLLTNEIGLIKDIPIKEVLTRLGVKISRDNFVMEGEEKTSASINIKENYINRFSGKPGSGSTIDAVMAYGNKSLSEAIAWLKEEWGIKALSPTQIAKAILESNPEPVIDPIDQPIQVFTWGTQNLDRAVTPIQPCQLIIVYGDSGAGKTTFCFDVATKNAQAGRKILFLSLEMGEDEIYTRLARAYAGIGKEEWQDRIKIPDYKRKAYAKRKNEVKVIKNLMLKGFPSGTEPTVANIEKLIETVQPDLAFIDNFDLICKDPKTSEYQEQNRIIGDFMRFCKSTRIPIIILHHKNKTKDDSFNAARGSGKIIHNADTVLKCIRQYDEDATPEENAKFSVKQEKDRDFGELTLTTIYFKHGTFNDKYLDDSADPHWWNNI